MEFDRLVENCIKKSEYIDDIVLSHDRYIKSNKRLKRRLKKDAGEICFLKAQLEGKDKQIKSLKAEAEEKDEGMNMWKNNFEQMSKLAGSAATKSLGVAATESAAVAATEV